MSLFPSIAKLELLSENKTEPRIDPTQIILHTAVDAPGPSNLYLYFEKSTNLESHFFIQNDGTIIQYMDTNRQADANASANVRAISIETEDDGSVRPWTAAQVASIKRLGAALMQAHPKIARRVCTAHDKPGWGYHVMFGAPGPWTPVPGKKCPGGPRIQQFNTDITSWLAGGINPGEDDLPYTLEQLTNAVAAGVKKALAPGGVARQDVINLIVGTNQRSLRKFQEGDDPAVDGALRDELDKFLDERENVEAPTG